MQHVITPCSSIAPCILKNPVAHCWSEPVQHKRKNCSVCRKRIDESTAVHCMSKLADAVFLSSFLLSSCQNLAASHFTGGNLFNFFVANLCRPRLVCEYYVHIECQDFAIPDCKENATYVPGKDLSSVKHQVSVKCDFKSHLFVFKCALSIRWIIKLVF